METPLFGKKFKVLTSKQNATKMGHGTSTLKIPSKTGHPPILHGSSRLHAFPVDSTKRVPLNFRTMYAARVLPEAQGNPPGRVVNMEWVSTCEAGNAVELHLRVFDSQVNSISLQ